MKFRRGMLVILNSIKTPTKYDEFRVIKRADIEPESYIVEQIYDFDYKAHWMRIKAGQGRKYLFPASKLSTSML